MECIARIEEAVLADPDECDRILRAAERTATKRKQAVVEATSDGAGASATKQTRITQEPGAGASGAEPGTQPQAAGADSAPATRTGTGTKRKTPEEEDVDMDLILDLMYDPDEEVVSLLVSLHESYPMSIQEQVNQGLQHPVCEARDTLTDFDPDWWTAFDDVEVHSIPPWSRRREERKSRSYAM